jgi:hypothetical protein
MLEELLLSSPSGPTVCADLLKIKQIQQNLKLHLSKMIEQIPNRNNVEFGARESLSSRATVRKQVRFPKIPKRRPASSRRFRAPSADQAATIKERLELLDVGAYSDAGPEEYPNVEVLDAVDVDPYDIGTHVFINQIAYMISFFAKFRQHTVLRHYLIGCQI